MCLNGAAARQVQVGDHILKGLFLLANGFPGLLYDLLRQPQLLGDGKGIAFAGNADE